ncbi:TetR/AcrR family transcriptional regulator [Mycobacterium hubeiense]|uniref:TetR/AcrR family transcriptional regulator n=1 Tax=Mycobacterium hubeiense TaxID=1867256 RepID=UPI0013044A08|nr:TetR/AcrR family transcriptional regulator [Mycobacterium sp. QGD 101]
MSQAARPKRRLRPEERRQQLIDAAIELYSTRPYERVSVDDITEAADVSRALFYRYFENPAQLFAAASRVAIDGLIARLTAVPDGTPHEQARQNVLEFITFAEQHRNAIIALFRNGSAISPESGNVIDEVRTAVVNHIKQLAGLTDTDALTDLTLWCWMPVVEEATLRWLHEPTVSRDTLADWLTAQFFGMLGATEQFKA